MKILISFCFIILFCVPGCDSEKKIIDFYISGNQKREMKDIEGAIIDYKKAIEIKPKSAEDFYYHGNMKMYLNGMKINDILGDFNKAIELNPQYFDAYIKRASLKNSLKINDYSGALSDCSKAYELNSNSKELYFEIANAEKGLNNFLNAMKNFNKALELDPKYKEAYIGRGELKNAQADHIGALNDFSKILSFDSTDVYVYQCIGDTKVKLKDSSFIIEFDKIINLEPNNSWSYFLRARANSSAGNFKTALNDFDYSIELLERPNEKERDYLFFIYYTERAECKKNLNDYEGAIKDYSKLIEKEPKDSYIYYLRGLAKYQIQDKKGALLDLSVSGELGNEAAYNEIKEIQSEN